MGKKSKAEAVAEAVSAVDTGDAEARERADRLIAKFGEWEMTRELAAKERKRCNENVQAKLAALKEGMEVGHSTQADQLLKLTVVEGRWQDLEDARTERKELMSSFKDQIKLCETRLREMIAEIKSPQLGLFNANVPSIDNPPTPEEDDDEPDPTADDEEDDDQIPD